MQVAASYTAQHYTPGGTTVACNNLLYAHLEFPGMAACDDNPANTCLKMIHS